MEEREQQNFVCKTARIRGLNDEFRKTGHRGTVILTPGIRQMGTTLCCQIIHAIRSYNEFGNHNDPYNEHDFGALSVAEQTVFWKIDYYDLDKVMGSPDPSDLTVTARVMTIMLGSEY